MRYVRFIINLGITYGVSESMKLIKYFNSDYDLNRLNRKSILAYIYMLNKESVFWMS